MKLPTPLYESLPYFYIGVCAVLLSLFNNNNPALFSALALYIFGSIIWIKRSNYRRRDRREQRLLLARLSRGAFNSYTPQWLYEEQPFIYLAGGIACITLLDNPLALISGSLLLLASITVLRARFINRHTFNTANSRA
jgi:hypothetical protein